MRKEKDATMEATATASLTHTQRADQLMLMAACCIQAANDLRGRGDGISPACVEFDVGHIVSQEGSSFVSKATVVLDQSHDTSTLIATLHEPAIAV